MGAYCVQMSLCLCRSRYVHMCMCVQWSEYGDPVAPSLFPLLWPRAGGPRFKLSPLSILALL